jgi:thiol-disulfide isomerase/thioredoxin
MSSHHRYRHRFSDALRITLFSALSVCGIAMASGENPAPEFTHRAASEWINSPPQSLAALRGKPVLIEFWAYECSNCLHTLPWLKSVQQRYSNRGLTIIGVHSPELPQEHDPENVRDAVKRFKITYPVMLDTDFSYWNALGNRYWPAFYLIDREGRLVATEIGELHEGTVRADRFKRAIEEALVTQ